MSDPVAEAFSVLAGSTGRDPQLAHDIYHLIYAIANERIEDFAAEVLREIRETKAYVGDGDGYHENTFKAFAYLEMAVERALKASSASTVGEK
jgi:hypothetical protein